MHSQPTVAAELKSVSRLYGRFAALRQVSATFYTGRCHVLVGENGAGKSTLLRTVAGLLSPSLGTVSVFGETPHNSRARIGYMSHATMLYDELSGLENLQYFARLQLVADCNVGHCTIAARLKSAPAEALRAVGLDPDLPRPVGQYSQGMRQRVALARVLLSQPDLLLLDEPFSNMDANSAAQMVALLGTMRTAFRTIILTTHQPALAQPIADSWLTMRAGQIISDVAPLDTAEAPV
jgi:ABC-type multidrug transport system ATPase subunit